MIKRQVFMMEEGSRMVNFVAFLLVVYCAFLSGPFCHAFTFGTRIVGKMHSRSHISMEWKGDRPPLPNMEFLDQRMDAAWGRGKFRDEVIKSCNRYCCCSSYPRF